MITGLLGTKGGVGKSLNSHAIAHGMTMLGIAAAYILTDKERDVLDDQNRVYNVQDGRTIPELEQAVTVAKGFGRAGMLVIDGGGNRGPVDELIASVCDLVILPFTPDDDAVVTCAKNMVKHPKAWAMPTAWPTNPKAAAVDKGYLNKLEEIFPGRILRPRSDTHSVRDLLLEQFDGTLLPPAQRYCRDIARMVLELMPQ